MSRKASPLFIETVADIQSNRTVAVQIQVGQFTEDGPEYDPDGVYEAVSVCDPIDEFDPILGMDLAFWRAVEKAARKNLKRLDGQIRHNDHARESRNRALQPMVVDGGVVWDGEFYPGAPVSPTQLEGFEFGEIVIYHCPEIADFDGQVGIIVGSDPDGIHAAVFHPEVDWVGQHVTYSPVECLV